MNEQLPHLTQLLRQLQRVPYVASKNIYRVAHHFLSLSPEQMRLFCEALQEAHRELIKCPRCCAWQERTGNCPFCDSLKREQSVVCVVETWHDLLAIEKSGGYQGAYHVLGGALSPLEGIGPEQLSVGRLRERLANGTCREIIIACNQTPEGDATAAYVARSLDGCGVTISRLARGLPVGATLEYMDKLTLHKALSERRLF